MIDHDSFAVVVIDIHWTRYNAVFKGLTQRLKQSRCPSTSLGNIAGQCLDLTVGELRSVRWHVAKAIAQCLSHALSVRLDFIQHGAYSALGLRIIKRMANRAGRHSLNKKRLSFNVSRVV